MTFKREDLSAENRKVFDTWRELGLSEEATLAMMRQDGLIKPDASASDGFGRMVAAFESLGLTASEARTAARGRDGRSVWSSVSEGSSSDSQLQEMLRLLAAMSDAEVNEMFVAEQARMRKRKASPKKNTTSRVVELHEGDSWR